jgi:perosamine synthetase
MNFIKAIARIGYHQSKNLINLTLDRPMVYSSLGSVTLDKDDVDIARKWLSERSNWYEPELVKQYEKEFAQWNGSKYAFAFMGGRIALSAAIHALNLRPGDEVILPGYTCVVVPNAFNFAEIQTVYSDIELDTYGLDASKIESKITNKTRAILLQHLYGFVCRDYEAIIEIAKNNGLFVIEDCAQSTGAEYKGKKVGNRGDIAFYSFEQSKIMTTIQGGMAITNNKSLTEGLMDYYNEAKYPEEEDIDRQLNAVIINYFLYKDPQRWWKGDLVRLWHKDKIIISTTKKEVRGIKPDYYGRKMPSSIAVIGLNQLKKVDKYNEKRRQTAKKWDEWCESNGYKKPVVVPDSSPVYLRYPVIVEPHKKVNTSWAQKELGVTLGVWFVSNIHPSNLRVTGCPNADKAVKQCVNFPGVL